MEGRGWGVEHVVWATAFEPRSWLHSIEAVVAVLLVWERSSFVIYLGAGETGREL